MSIRQAQVKSSKRRIATKAKSRRIGVETIPKHHPLMEQDNDGGYVGEDSYSAAPMVSAIKGHKRGSAGPINSTSNNVPALIESIGKSLQNIEDLVERFTQYVHGSQEKIPAYDQVGLSDEGLLSNLAFINSKLENKVLDLQSILTFFHSTRG